MRRQKYIIRQLELARIRHKRYKEKYPERIIASQRKYVKKNRKKINEKNKERAKKNWWINPEKYRKQQRDKYHENVEESRRKIKEYYRKNIEKKRQYARKYNKKLRQIVVKGYGGKCSCCGENNFEFLALDHVNGGGNKERINGVHSYTVYRRVIKENFPSEYRILCHNCNLALGFYGYCPHNLSKF